jgi:hypothetical protein
MSLVVTAVLFGLSLLAAWVLFNLLKSTAAVSRPEYQLGGAAAGFVVFLSLLSGIYIEVNNQKLQQQITDLSKQLADATLAEQKGDACIKERSTEITYAGTVTPPVAAANVVLGVSEVPLQQNGTFAIKAHNVKPSDYPYIYVIGADSHAPYKQVFAQDDPGKLTIPH